MTDEAEPTHHCRVVEPVDLFTALDAAGIEHLEIDDQRMVMIYRSAILMLIVTEGRATAACAFNVELWKPPLDDFNRDPNDLLTVFIDELLAVTGTTRC